MLINPKWFGWAGTRRESVGIDWHTLERGRNSSPIRRSAVEWQSSRTNAFEVFTGNFEMGSKCRQEGRSRWDTSGRYEWQIQMVDLNSKSKWQIKVVGPNEIQVIQMVDQSVDSNPHLTEFRAVGKSASNSQRSCASSRWARSEHSFERFSLSDLERDSPEERNLPEN